MISRKPNNLVPAKEQLQTLTPAELTEVSGGHDPWGRGGWGRGGWGRGGWGRGGWGGGGWGGGWHHRPHHWHPWGYGQH
jgi:hypothetical protein